MCEPASLTIASMAIAGAGAGASILGQQSQNSAAKQVEKQKENAVERQISENRRRASEEYVQSVMDEQLQQRQENEALVEQNIDLARTERDAVAKSNVAAGESGVAGQSLAAIQNDYRFQMDQAAGRLGISQAWRDHQHSRNIDAAGRTYENRVASVQPYAQQPVKPIDWYGPIFSAAGQSLDVATRVGAFRTNPLATDK